MEKSNNGQVLRRSERIRAKMSGAKTNKPDLSKYTEYIETLYGVGVDILIMIDNLVRKSLRNIIRRYENRGG